MTEIDKIVNQAFPDELRNVTPIPVDEEKVAALAFQKLGLERAEAPQPEKKPKRWGRYVGRHEKPREEPGLIAVPIEPARFRWKALAGWALAACILIAVGVRFGPGFIRSLPWEYTSPDSGVLAGGAVPEGGYEGQVEGITDDGADGIAESGTEETADVKVETSVKNRKVVPEAASPIKEVISGVEPVFATGESGVGRVRVQAVSTMDDQDRVTVTVLFPRYTVGEISQFNINLGPHHSSYVLSRENFEGYAQVTFALENIQGEKERGEPLAVDLLVIGSYDWDERFWGYDLVIDSTGQEPTVFMEFDEYGYAEYGFTFDGEGMPVPLDSDPHDTSGWGDDNPAATDS